MRKLRINDFFCGCGGMGIAFQNAGFEIVGAWDFDKYAVQSYRENVGDHVRQQDIKEMKYEDVPKADVWAFGFPCQDLSVAGKQRGMVLKCEDCGEDLEINPEEYQNKAVCPHCGGDNFKASSRSGCFFEMMRLLEETERNAPENLPAVIIAENVRGLKPYLPVLELEYERHGYTAHIEMFNSKYWGAPQNRERYAVVGTRDSLGLKFEFPKEQHETVPKLSDFMEKNVDEKYYIPDEKAQTIISQAMEKLETLGKCHACITPDRINKRQNGPRAKAEDEPMFTLTAQDLHGVIILEDVADEKDVGMDRKETSDDKSGCILIGKLDIKGKDQWRRVYSTDGIAPTLVTCQGGQQQAKIFDTKRLRVRKLTPREYGILQAFSMDRWNQVVSDSQAYKQFGNAVTTTVFTPIAEQIKIAILESEGESMEELNGVMNEPEEKQETKDEVKKENIQVEELAEKIVSHLFEKTLLPGFVFDAAVASTIIFINENLDGIRIGEKAEDNKDWPAAQKALETELDKYAGMGTNGIYILKALTPLKARLDGGERTPELFNAIVDATR